MVYIRAGEVQRSLIHDGGIVSYFSHFWSIILVPCVAILNIHLAGLASCCNADFFEYQTEITIPA
jgi:hypothetical protein